MSSDGGRGTAKPSRLNYTCYSLAQLIADAFDVPGHRMSGFDRLGLKMVTISAVLPEGATKDQMRTMLQNLLAERFQLKVRHETREGNAYELTVEASGHKLRENADPALCRKMTTVPGGPVTFWDGRRATRRELGSLPQKWRPHKQVDTTPINSAGSTTFGVLTDLASASLPRRSTSLLQLLQHRCGMPVGRIQPDGGLVALDREGLLAVL